MSIIPHSPDPTERSTSVNTGCRDMSLHEVLSDPLTRAVMAADRVDPQELAAELTETAKRLARIPSNVA
jgi:hypothetical protein